MELLLLLTLSVLHFITGAGLLRLIGLKEHPLLVKAALSIISGVIIGSISCFMLQLAYIPLTIISVYSTLFGLALLLNIGTIIRYKNWHWPNCLAYNIKLYEWPFILFLCYTLIGSTWRCYYLPTQARDMMSGPESIAEFALSEHTFINSVFQIDLQSTNNQFKSPFMHALLLIYKMAGFKYGGLWLPQIAFSFMALVYSWLKKTIHPIVAGLLSLLLLSAPEFFTYTYLVLYDYSNTVLFFIGYYFLLLYVKNWQRANILFAAFMFSASVYVRSETFILVVLMLPLLLYRGWKDKVSVNRVLFSSAGIGFSSFLAYFIVIQVYNNHYLPQTYAMQNLINHDLMNVQPLLIRMGEVWDKLLSGEWSIILYGYIFKIFFAFFIAELVVKRKFSRSAAEWLYGVFAVYFGLLITGFLFPLMDIDNSTKRGLFKVLPLIVFYLANNYFTVSLSDMLHRLEYKKDKTPVMKSGNVHSK